MSVSENISRVAAAAVGDLNLNLNTCVVLLTSHLFTKLDAKSTNTREAYFRLKYCQTLPFPLLQTDTTYSQASFGNFDIFIGGNKRNVKIKMVLKLNFKFH